MKPVQLLLVVVTSLLVGKASTEIGKPLLPPEGAVPEVPDDVEGGFNRVRDSFYAQCREQGVSDPEKLVRDVGNNFQKCIGNKFNMTEIQKDIARHTENGDLEVLFSKHCSRLPPIIYNCTDVQLAKLTTCLNETERERNYAGYVMKGLRAAVDFLCHQDGERIAIFLGNKGQECVSDHAVGESIRTCLKSHNLSEPVGDQLGGLRNGFTPDNCRRLFASHGCVVDGLRLCEDSTPSNVVDSLLLAVEKPLPCNRTTSGAGQVRVAGWPLLLSSTLSLVLLLVRYL